MNMLLTLSLAATLGLVFIVHTTGLPLDSIVGKQRTYHDLLFPHNDTPIPKWDIPVNRFLTQKLACCKSSPEDILSGKNRAPMVSFWFRIYGHMQWEIRQENKNGTPTHLARYTPELVKHLYKLEHDMTDLYFVLRDQIMKGEAGTDKVQNEFEFSLVMFNSLIGFLEQIEKREKITQVPAKYIPKYSDLYKHFFTKEMIEKMDKDRRGLLTAWEKMNPLEQCSDMKRRGLTCTADVYGVYTSTTIQAPSTRSFHESHRIPKGRKPRRN